MKNRNITHYISRKSQEGVTLFVCLIILILMTLVAISAFNVGNSNLKSVANMQFREEAIYAGNKAIEQVIGSPFTDNPAAETVFMDINNDGINDYTINISKPICTQAYIEFPGGKSSVTLGANMTSSSDWGTVWEFEAVVKDNATGAAVTVTTGVRVLMTLTKKNQVCI